jgi:hypothetical protein
MDEVPFSAGRVQKTLLSPHAPRSKTHRHQPVKSEHHVETMARRVDDQCAHGVAEANPLASAGIASPALPGFLRGQATD